MDFQKIFELKITKLKLKRKFNILKANNELAISQTHIAFSVPFLDSLHSIMTVIYIYIN